MGVSTAFLAQSLGRIFLRPGAAMRSVAAFTACSGGEFVILREAPLGGIDALSPFAPGLGRQRRILREAPFFVRNALSALACDRPLLVGIH